MTDQKFKGFRRWRPALIRPVFLILIAAVIVQVLWRAAAQKDSQQFQNRYSFTTRLQRGIGSEVYFTKTGSPEESRKSVESAATFIYERSGITLGEKSKERLALLEGQTAAGKLRALSAQEAVDLLSSVALNRISTMSDEEVSGAVESLRGFSSPELPKSFQGSRNQIWLRASKSSALTADSLSTNLKAMRSKSGAIVMMNVAKPTIDGLLTDRLSIFAEILPEIYGEAKQQPDSPALSPVPLLLIAYSLASDDLMSDSLADLKARMAKIQQSILSSGSDYPSPSGYFAYGENGYLYASPANYFFDDHTLTNLMDQIEERSKR